MSTKYMGPLNWLSNHSEHHGVADQVHQVGGMESCEDQQLHIPVLRHTQENEFKVGCLVGVLHGKGMQQGLNGSKLGAGEGIIYRIYRIYINYMNSATGKAKGSYWSD